jgi:uncharacterized protein (DUF4415 family)
MSKLTKEAVKDIVRRAKDKEPYKTIAADHDISFQTASYTARARGVPMRKGTIAGLRTTTIYLEVECIEWFRRKYGYGFSGRMRDIIHSYWKQHTQLLEKIEESYDE